MEFKTSLFSNRLCVSKYVNILDKFQTNIFKDSGGELYLLLLGLNRDFLNAFF